jgi:O-antigen ligase
MLVGAVFGLPDRLLRRQIYAWAAGATAVLLLLLLFLTKSRGATAATLGAVVVALLLSRNRRYRRFALLGMVALAGAALLYFGLESGSEQFESFVNRGQTTEQVLSLSQRTDLFDIGMGYFRDQPIFGHGYMIPGALLRTHFFWAGHAHNVALEIAMGMGIVGIAAFLAVVLLSIRGLWAAWRFPPGPLRGIGGEGAAILVLLLLQGIISDGFGGPVGFEVAGLALVVLIADLGIRWRRLGVQPAYAPNAVPSDHHGASEA